MTGLQLSVLTHPLPALCTEAMGVVATFFVTGEQVRDHPSVAAAVVAAGHEIAVKGDRHRTRVGARPLDALGA